MSERISKRCKQGRNPMKQLDEMERMARGVVDAADADIRFADETGNAHHVFNDEMLARALLAVMPVVRAAEALAGSSRHLLPLHLRPLADAVDDLRRLGGE